MIIEDARHQDAAEILALQKLAYRSEAELNQDYGIPPLMQSLEGIQQQFETHLFLKAVVDGHIIGSVRAHQEGGTCYIGRLIVHPDFQSRGIGMRLMAEIERRFDGAERFELFTSERSERNLHLYQKLGYRSFRRESLTGKVTLVYLEKTTPTRSR